MGACCSSPAADGEAYKKGGAKRGKQQIPDFGLGDTFDVKKFLGKGAEGEAWLCQVSKRIDSGEGL